MAGIRKDIASFGNGWSPATEWYARAVRAMLAKPITDPTSWRALAAIHGINALGWQQAHVLPAGPLPAIKPEWNQCQHGNWFFLPWHRGYLASFEAIVAATIVSIGGPAGWTLPYWNYLDTTAVNPRSLPRVFTLAKLPDGSANPLKSWPRQFTVLAPHPPAINNDISLAAMSRHRFTSANGTIGLGGSASSAGALELNPHNLVHIMIGGVTGQTGFMSDPDFAGLDPIFWLHHCNIDRLWAAWLATTGNIQENGAAWKAGPALPKFILPDPHGELKKFNPGQTLPGQPLEPRYDNLTKGTGLHPGAPMAIAGAGMPASLSDEPPEPATLVSAAVTNAVVAPGASVSTPLGLESSALPAALDESRLYLNIEHVTGEQPSAMLDVHIGLKGAAEESPGQAHEYVDSLPLFGLKRASEADGPHAGNGLSMVVDITDAVATLRRNADVAPEDLEVTITQPGEGEGTSPVHIGRVSVFSQTAE